MRVWRLTRTARAANFSRDRAPPSPVDAGTPLAFNSPVLPRAGR